MPNKPSLFLRIVDGPQRGARIAVQEGLILGRKEGDLVISDPKLSIRHAQIEWKNGEWALVDLGSSNKIKVDGTRYAEVVLYGGLTFVVGSTSIEVLERSVIKAAVGPAMDPTTDPNEATRAISDTEAQMETPGAESNGITWKEILTGLVDRAKQAAPAAASDKNRSEHETPHALPALIKMEFLSGPQHGTVWTIGYGPRSFGSRAFDLSLVDAIADSSFRIDSKGSKVVFQATQGALVRFNGKKAPPHEIELHSGDRIEVGKTRIRLTFE